MEITVVIATTGRPDVLGQTLTRLARQTRSPDRIIVVGASESDFDPRDGFEGVQFVVSAKGSAKQRNCGLDLLAGTAGAVIFLDDDFIPASDFIAGAERLMIDHPEVVAASGHLLADEIRSAGISLAQADALIASHEARSRLLEDRIVDQTGAYGCNMIVRVGALPDARFDENLPLYGWLEDLDFSSRFAAAGRVVETGLCVGVHLGVKTGRTPGLRLGYSQIANPLYLAAKGTMDRRKAVTMATKNVIANSLRSLWPEPYIDRRGRLKGNLLAIADLVLGRIHPMRVLSRRIAGQAAGARQPVLGP